MSRITLEQAVEWRAPVWAPAVKSALDRGSKLLGEGSNVLEIGYNSGLMSCFISQEYDWNVVGYELLEDQKKKAIDNAITYGFQEKIDFRVCPPEETFNIPGTYDGIFLKSVLYHNKDRQKYKEWIKWLHSKLKYNGVLIAVENCHGHALDRLYREKIRNVTWKDNVLFDSDLASTFQDVFKKVDIEYYGGVSQYLTAVPALCYTAQKVEKMIGFNNADNCFIASIVAFK